MAKIECFDADGKMHMKEPVDARECVASCGFTMTRPEVKAEIAEIEQTEPKTYKTKKG